MISYTYLGIFFIKGVDDSIRMLYRYKNKNVTYLFMNVLLASKRARLEPVAMSCLNTIN